MTGSYPNPLQIHPLFHLGFPDSLRRVDNAIHRINFYLVDSAVCFVDTKLLDSNFFVGKCYLPFEHLGPGWTEALQELCVFFKKKTQRVDWPWPKDWIQTFQSLNWCNSQFVQTRSLLSSSIPISLWVNLKYSHFLQPLIPPIKMKEVKFFKSSSLHHLPCPQISSGGGGVCAPNLPSVILRTLPE